MKPEKEKNRHTDIRTLRLYKTEDEESEEKSAKQDRETDEIKMIQGEEPAQTQATGEKGDGESEEEVTDQDQETDEDEGMQEGSEQENQQGEGQTRSPTQRQATKKR